MKILYLVFDLSAPGGIRAYNEDFLKVLKENGNELRVVELNTSSRAGKLSFIARACVAALIFRPTLAIAGHVNFSPLCLFLKRIFIMRYVVMVYGIDAWNVSSSLKIAALQGADRIISISSYTSKRLTRSVGGLKEKFVLIPPMVNPKRFKPNKKSGTLLARYALSGKKVILTVARLSAVEGYKGYDRIIQAMPDILEKVPEARYVLMGGGDDSGRVEQMVRDLGLTDKVVLAGRASDDVLVEAYHSADVFAMPSTGEGFGIVFIEASACGVPVIAGNRDGSVDAALHGELGLLVDPENTTEIAQAIITILNGSAAKRLYDKEFLRRKTLEHFGPEAFTKKVGLFIDAFEK